MELKPINESFSENEFIVRNVYHSSQYSNSNGLKKNYLYPNYKKESKDFPGRHVCRVSVQRVCYGGWQGVTEIAMKFKRDNQELVGFSLAPAAIIESFGFSTEPAAHDGNPLHAHIYIPELDLPYPNETIDEVMIAGLRRKLDELTENFEFMQVDQLADFDCRHYKSQYKDCLNSNSEN